MHQKNQNKQAKESSNDSGADIHIPVLLSEVLDVLAPQEGERYLDATAGYGGHAQTVLQRTQYSKGSVLVDRDQTAISHLETKFKEQELVIMHSDFYSAAQVLRTQGEQFDMILADLGVSSLHFDTASRGFSFQEEGPLDMRMDQRQALTADSIVNTYDADQLVRILRDYGEEPKAPKIARAIIESRPVTTTKQLAAIVARAWPGKSKSHPATRTFQALRLAVNDELELLRQAIPLWVELLAPGGRLAVISFHSLEDRIVKQTLAEYAGDRYDADLRLLSKQPLTGGKTELVSNPRARSAKLRAAVKIKI